MSNATVLTDRFDRALIYATHVHGGQIRKGTSTPYIAHLLAVAATVLEYGGDEDIAIAALLHDSVEDQGGKARLEDVRNRFGQRVARIVEACSDSLADTGRGSVRLIGKSGRKPISHTSERPTRISFAYRWRTRFTMRARSFVTLENRTSATKFGHASVSLKDRTLWYYRRLPAKTGTFHGSATDDRAYFPCPQPRSKARRGATRPWRPRSASSFSLAPIAEAGVGLTR